MKKYAIDFRLVREKLEKVTDFADFCRLIRQYDSCCSTRNDLRSASNSITTLKNIHEFAEMRKAYGEALVTHAVLMYTRSCHSKQSRRSNVGATKDFTSRHKACHARVVDLRDKVIAHFGDPIFFSGRDWVKERPTYIVTDDHEGLAFCSIRSIYNLDIVADLTEVISRSLETITKIIEEKDAALCVQIEERISDLRLKNAIESSPFQPEKFYHSAEAVRSYWENTSGSIHTSGYNLPNRADPDE
ncbi:hypothetical protein [Rhizobium sp. Root483D2]|uniref:hypothetical protein n=1 Tax=Rhizobium sp. Root483D2 TaxID=1736545 RepID=UPI000B031CF0|nr:hypothetical protein [Rhizobium sp. Root483D2]